MIKLKIFSKTQIYPLNDQDKSLSMITQGLLQFSKLQIQDSIQYFKTKNLTVVFQTWHGVTFIMIGFNEEKSLLSHYLHAIHQLTIFIFGESFEKSLTNSICLKDISVYSRYIDAFLQNMNKNNYLKLRVVKHNSFSPFKNHDKIISSASTLLSRQMRATPIECLIFRNHELLTRIPIDNNLYITDEALFNIYLFESLEFVHDSNVNNNIDPNYVKEEDIEIKVKKVYLCLNDGRITKYKLSALQLGEHSSIVMILVSGSELNTNDLTFFRKYITVITDSLNDSIGSFKKISIEYPIGLVYYLVVNRSDGEMFEILSEDHMNGLMNLIIGNAFEKSIVSLYHHQSFSLIDDGLFKFVRELIFIDSDGEYITPYRNTCFNSFEEDSEVNFNVLVNQSCFPSKSQITCFEMVCVYLSFVATSDIYKINRRLFKQYYEDRSEHNWRTFPHFCYQYVVPKRPSIRESQSYPNISQEISPEDDEELHP